MMTDKNNTIEDYRARALARFHTWDCLEPTHVKCGELVDLVLGLTGVAKVGPVNCRTTDEQRNMLHKRENIADPDSDTALCGLKMTMPWAWHLLEWEEVRMLRHGVDCQCPPYEEWPKCPTCAAIFQARLDEAETSRPSCPKCGHKIADGDEVEIVTDDPALLPTEVHGKTYVPAEMAVEKMIVYHVECPAS